MKFKAALIMLLLFSGWAQAKGKHFATVSWSASTTQPVSYRVYRGQRGGPYLLIASNLFQLSFQDSSTLPHRTYCYVVTAYNGVESKFSNEACGTMP